MKTKRYICFVLTAALAFSVPKANAQVLIQYWDFNATIPVGGAGGDSLGNATNPLTANQVIGGLTAGHIIYSRPTAMYNPTLVDGILDNGTQGSNIYDHSNSNDTGGTAAGNLFVRTRNPSDSCEMLLYIPTTGYKNISLDFALSASSSKGPNYGLFSYSTNGGSTWNKLTRAMDTFNIGGIFHPDTLQLQNPVTAASAWYPVQINFSTVAAVNSNANFVVKMLVAGLNSHEQTSGNARFDNFSVWGTSTTTGVDELSAQAAGYDLYPNPAGSFVNLSGHYTGNKIITVYNLVGQTVSVTENHELQTTINTSSLNAGVYFVEIKEVETGNKYTVKLVKE
jgi:hypothetical protein